MMHRKMIVSVVVLYALLAMSSLATQVTLQYPPAIAIRRRCRACSDR